MLVPEVKLCKIVDVGDQNGRNRHQHILSQRCLWETVDLDDRRSDIKNSQILEVDSRDKAKRHSEGLIQSFQQQIYLIRKIQTRNMVPEFWS